MGKYNKCDYSLYTYAQAEDKLIRQLAGDSNNCLFELVLYPQFIREVVQTTKLFMSKQTHMLKSVLPYDGNKTVLACAMMAAGQTLKPCCVGYDSKGEYINTIMKYLTAWFNNNKQTANNYCCLAFKVNEESKRDYLQLVTDYLAKQESKLLVYGIQTAQEEEQQGEVKVAVSLLESLGITSCRSSRYEKFVEACQKWVKIAVHLDRRHVKHTLQQTPAIFRYCSMVQIKSAIFKNEGIVNRSLGILYSQLSIQEYISKQKQQLSNSQNKQHASSQFGTHIFSQHDKNLLRHITVLEQTVLSKYVKESKRKVALLECIKLAIKIYLAEQAKFKQTIEHVRNVIKKKQETLEQKRQIEKDLAVLIPKLNKMVSANQLMLGEVNKQTSVFQQKKLIHSQHAQIVATKKQLTDKIQMECQAQLDKVMPMLQSAEQSLAKVTRDDINQLRSFPNPPLPAVKVVESLCFVFNEDQLIKEKVGENGTKFKDYWEYAKKFILNDRLLKRVTEFKPDYIKNLNKNKMNILKVLIRQQYFREQKVFKASSAAGNLSVWMRAVVLTFEVMEIIEPKKKQLAEALQDLRAAKQVENDKRAEMDSAEREKQKRQLKYNEQMNKQLELEHKIQQLKGMIKRSEQFLSLLQKMQEVWKKQIEVELPNKIEKAKTESFLFSMTVIYLSKLGESERKEIRTSACKILQVKNMNILQNQLASHYLQLLLINGNQNTQIQCKQNEQGISINTQEDKSAVQIHMQVRKSEDDLALSGKSKQSEEKKQKQQKQQQQQQKQQQQIKQQRQQQVRQKVKIERIIRFNIVSEYYSQNLISMMEQLKNMSTSMIVLDESETFVQLVKQYYESANKQNEKINEINNNNDNNNNNSNNNEIYEKQQSAGMVKIIDCLMLDKYADIYCTISQSKSKQSRKLLLIINLQQLPIQFQSQLLKFVKKQVSPYRIIVIMHSCPINYHTHSTHDGQWLQFNVYNTLIEQTKQALLESLLCPTSKPHTALSSKLAQYRHLQQLHSLFQDLQNRFYHCNNILLDDYNINTWASNYHSYWQLLESSPTVKLNGSIEKQVIHSLGSTHCWENYTTYIDFVNIVYTAVKQSHKQNIYVVANRVIDTFQKGPQPANKLPQTNNIRNTATIQSSQQLQTPQIEQEQIMPFSAFTFVQMTSLANISSNTITQFVKERKKQRKSSGTTHLSNSQQVIYEPSVEKALSNLIYLTQNQKQIVICCQTKFEAYKTYEQMHQFYVNFCNKAMEGDDEFSPQSYGFKAYLLVIGEQNILKKREWRIIKLNNQIDNQGNNKQYLVKQFKVLGQSLIKAEKLYSEKLIYQNSIFE